MHIMVHAFIKARAIAKYNKNRRAYRNASTVVIIKHFFDINLGMVMMLSTINRFQMRKRKEGYDFVFVSQTVTLSTHNFTEL